MIVSNDPIKFKPTYRPEQTKSLQNILSSFNLEMTHIKKEWAISVMHYNLTSRFAYEHRFKKIPLKNGRQTGDGIETEYTTAEQESGSFIIPPLVKNKVDQYLQEFQMRDYTCSVSSFVNEEYKYLTEYLMKQSFGNPEFKNALTSAFKDALLKKVGFIRPRIYDINKDTLVPMVQKEKDKIFNFFYKSKPIKNGLVIEYVDVENVYYNPNYKSLSEFIISTPYSYFDLINLYPQLWQLINPNFQINDSIAQEYINYYDRNDVLITNEYVPNWQVGEFFTKWYYRPELFNSCYNNDLMAKIKQQNTGNYNFQDFSNRDYFTNSFGTKFNQTWNNFFFGDGYSQFLDLYTRYQNIFRLNEYYNIPANRYILYIGDYILYDGAILEPFDIDCPLQPIYFDHTESMGVEGKSVNDHIHSLQVDASLMATRSKQILEASSVSFIEINTERLQDPETPMDVNIMNFIRTTEAVSGNNTPALQQLQIQNVGLELYPQYENKILAEVEKIFPSTELLTNQLSKEEKEKVIASRNLRTDFFLRYNGYQLTKFAYKVFAVKLTELLMQDKSEIVIDLGLKGQIGLVIRSGEKEIMLAKKKILEILNKQYKQQLTQAKEQIAQTPEFKQKLDEINQALIQQGRQDMAIPEVKKQIQDDSQARARYSDALKQNQLKQAEELLNQMASQSVPQPQDNNWYLNFEQITDLQQARKQFTFSFNETDLEKQKKTIDFITLMSQIPLSEFALDYSKFARELAVNMGFNPNTILTKVAPPTELTGIKNTKATTYYDMQKNPVLATAITKQMYGVDVSQLEFDQNSSLVQGVLYMENQETKNELEKIKAKTLLEGQSNIVKESAKQQLLNSNLPQENDQ